jgi:uncharacterized integral membrane protein
MRVRYGPCMADDKSEGTHQGSGIGTGRLIAIVVVAVAAAFLIFGNLDSTTVWLWGFTLEMPLFLLLIIMFVLGMVLGGVVRSAFRKLRGAEPRTK